MKWFFRNLQRNGNYKNTGTAKSIKYAKSFFVPIGRYIINRISWGNSSVACQTSKILSKIAKLQYRVSQKALIFLYMFITLELISRNDSKFSSSIYLMREGSPRRTSISSRNHNFQNGKVQYNSNIFTKNFISTLLYLYLIQ